MERTRTAKAYMRSSPGRKLWAVACVVGFTAFWTYGFIALAGIFGDRDVHPVSLLLCAAGLALGVAGWRRVAAATPRMHGRRAAARARLEAETEEHAG